jgi:hypothetical protein
MSLDVVKQPGPVVQDLPSYRKGIASDIESCTSQYVGVVLLDRLTYGIL